MKKLVIKYLYDLRCEGCGAIDRPVSEHNMLCHWCMARWLSIQLHIRKLKRRG